jgi:hypothetical protein
MDFDVHKETAVEKYPMTDEQYRSLKLHLRVVIVLLGLMLIILLTMCWAYISLPD